MKCSKCGREIGTDGCYNMPSGVLCVECGDLANMSIKDCMSYFDQQVGHFSDVQKCTKIIVETAELFAAINNENKKNIQEECADIITIAYHIAVKNGYKQSPGTMIRESYIKMKNRIDLGLRDYKNKDF